jgi:hypothetical protein
MILFPLIYIAHFDQTIFKEGIRFLIYGMPDNIYKPPCLTKQFIKLLTLDKAIRKTISIKINENNKIYKYRL